MLCTVRDTSHYYSSDESACLPCEGNEFWPLWIGLGVLAGFGLLGVGRHYRQRVPRRLRVLLRSRHSRFLGVYSQISLRAELKQMMTFCEWLPFEPGHRRTPGPLIRRPPRALSDQVVTRIAEVFQLQLPIEVQPLLSRPVWRPTVPTSYSKPYRIPRPRPFNRRCNRCCRCSTSSTSTSPP